MYKIRPTGDLSLPGCGHDEKEYPDPEPYWGVTFDIRFEDIFFGNKGRNPPEVSSFRRSLHSENRFNVHEAVRIHKMIMDALKPVS